MVSASPRDTEEELLQTIKGIFLGNDLTMVGGGYHKIIEGEAQIVEGGLVADDIFFTAEQARAGLEFKSRHKHMIHEVSISKDYQTKFGPVRVSGRVDGMEGRVIRDAKCKFRSPDFQGYIDSYQWRYYEDILLLDCFYYDLFEVKGFKALTGALPYQLPGVSFHAHDPLQCVRYPNLGGDCLAMLNDFLEYIDLRNYWPALKTVPDQVAA